MLLLPKNTIIYYYDEYGISQMALVVKNLPANAGHARGMSSTSVLGRSPGVRDGKALQYSCLENPMDRGAWWATVHGVTESQMWLSSMIYILLLKVHLVKAMVFPVVMYGYESWTVKKAERQRIDAFELWCWGRLLRVPWTARRSNQSILKEISLGISLEGMMLKLKLQYFGHLMWSVDSLEKTLMLGGIGGRRRRGWDGWMASLTQWTWVWVIS